MAERSAAGGCDAPPGDKIAASTVTRVGRILALGDESAARDAGLTGFAWPGPALHRLGSHGYPSLRLVSSTFPAQRQAGLAQVRLDVER